MAGYTYDSTGQYYFFVLTVLLCVLLPLTYTTLRGGANSAASRVPYPCVGWNVKTDQVRRSKSGSSRSLLSLRMIILAVGWLAFALVVHRASSIEGEAVAFDPFKILGVSTSATEKQIKKHYRKLSLKFHPDKMVLGVNQTKEEADNVFVELTKAYKALTDEVSRHNFELFGHPDGKQEFSQGIALPSWVVESSNKWYVMAAYALILGVLLPVLVGRWWYGTRALTKDGVLNTSAAKYFRALKEESSFPELLDLLANSDEFVTDSKLIALRKSPRKPTVDEFARVTSLVREGPDGKAGGWEGYASWTTPRKRARVLIAAYMLRLPLKDATLYEEQLTTVSIALPLCNGLISIALSHNWLSTLIAIMHLQQFLLQALHPSSSPLLQLPHISEEIVARTKKELEVENIKQFGALGAGSVEKLLSGFPERKKRDVFEVAKNWPVCEIVDASFKVVGEKVVTPGAIVSFTLKLRLSPPGQVKQQSEATKKRESALEDDQDGETSIDELIGRRKSGADGEEPSPVAHAPHFPRDRKPTWSIFVGDHKLNRVFVAPHKFTDMGSKQVRTKLVCTVDSN